MVLTQALVQIPKPQHNDLEPLCSAGFWDTEQPIVSGLVKIYREHAAVEGGCQCLGWFASHEGTLLQGWLGQLPTDCAETFAEVMLLLALFIKFR
jgi:hypothetical protein